MGVEGTRSVTRSTSTPSRVKTDQVGAPFDDGGVPRGRVVWHARRLLITADPSALMVNEAHHVVGQQTSFGKVDLAIALANDRCRATATTPTLYPSIRSILKRTAYRPYICP